MALFNWIVDLDGYSRLELTRQERFKGCLFQAIDGFHNVLLFVFFNVCENLKNLQSLALQVLLDAFVGSNVPSLGSKLEGPRLGSIGNGTVLADDARKQAREGALADLSHLLHTFLGWLIDTLVQQDEHDRKKLFLVVGLGHDSGGGSGTRETRNLEKKR